MIEDEWDLIYKNKYFKLFDDGTFCYTMDYYDEPFDQTEFDECYLKMTEAFPEFFEDLEFE